MHVRVCVRSVRERARVGVGTCVRRVQASSLCRLPAQNGLALGLWGHPLGRRLHGAPAVALTGCVTLCSGADGGCSWTPNPCTPTGTPVLPPGQPACRQRSPLAQTSGLLQGLAGEVRPGWVGGSYSKPWARSSGSRGGGEWARGPWSPLVKLLARGQGGWGWLLARGHAALSGDWGLLPTLLPTPPSVPQDHPLHKQ